MDFLSSKRFVTTALVLLVILNVILMGVLWWQNFVTSSYQSVKVTRFYSSNGAKESVELGLTDQQKETFRKLRQEHFRKTMPGMQKIVNLKKELITESVKPSPDKARLSAIADSIGKHQARLERDLADHFHELSAVCKPAQRDSLEKLLTRIYTSRYQRMTSWKERPHRVHREERYHGPFQPPHPQP
jgi:Spy/CpxP family protein refolding chaperone